MSYRLENNAQEWARQCEGCLTVVTISQQVAAVLNSALSVTSGQLTVTGGSQVQRGIFLFDFC